MTSPASAHQGLGKLEFGTLQPHVIAFKVGLDQRQTEKKLKLRISGRGMIAHDPATRSEATSARVGFFLRDLRCSSAG